MRACTSCGKENPPSARFCIDCGNALGSACRACGAAVPIGARFCPSCGRAQETSVAFPPTEMLKIVTVLFADVVGSTARAEKMHPEDVRALMTDFFRAMREEIEHEGGTIERIVGDGLMAIFGLPLAHEDDPIRAVRAAKRMLGRLERWNTSQEETNKIEVRIGINTGEVSTVGSSGEDLLVTGDPVNVAARLEEAAAPGAIMIGERTARSVRRYFELLGPISLAAKGKTQPLQAFTVQDATSPEETPDQIVAPLVGRSEEFGALIEVFERCRRSKSPHLVTLLGEAGVGKSRLTRELLARLKDEALVLAGSCISHGEGAELWPLREVLGSAAGFERSDQRERVVGAIESLTTRLPVVGKERQETIDALASTVGMEPASFRELDPRVQHRAFLTAWRALLSALAVERPLVVMIQDIHWAGELMLDVLTDLACRTDGAILILCPSRPDLIEARPNWGTGAANHTMLRLGALSEEQSGELVDQLLDLQGIAQGLRKLILDRCEGNPFFIQEVIRHLLETGQLDSEGPTHPSVQADIAIPDNVHGVLLARIDLMNDQTKRVGQQAAVVGRIFWESAISRLSDSPSVSDALDTLQRKAFITESSSSTATNEIEYHFNHVLISDALYQTMPRRLRGASHEIVAAWIEDMSDGRTDEHLDTLAHHYEKAHELLSREDLRLKARDHLLRASKNALHRFATKHSAELARKAIELSRGTAERIEALEAAGDSAITAYCIDDAWSAYCEAFTDAARAGDQGMAVARLAAKAAIAATRFEGAIEVSPSDEDIMEKIELGLAATGSSDDDVRARCLLLASKAFGGVTVDWKDQVPAAAEARALADQLQDPELMSVALDASAFALGPDSSYGQMYLFQRRRIELIPKLRSVGEICDIYGSACWSSYFVGHFKDAILYATQCLKRAEGIDIGNYEHALQWRVMANFRAGHWDAALRDQSELERLVLEDSSVPPVFVSGAFATAFLCHQLRGQRDAADRYLEMLRELKAKQQAAGEGSGPLRPPTALGLVHRGELDEALDWVDYESGFVLGSIFESRCEVARAQEDPGSIATLIATLEEAIPRMGMPTLRCYADRLSGSAARLEGDAAGAKTFFVESAEGFARVGFPWEEATSRLLLAEQGLDDGDIQGAEPQLHQALLIFENLGSVQEIERARKALVRC